MHAVTDYINRYILPPNFTQEVKSGQFFRRNSFKAYKRLSVGTAVHSPEL